MEKKLTESVMWYKEKEKVKNGDIQDQEISQMETGFSLETEEFKNWEKKWKRYRKGERNKRKVKKREKKEQGKRK